ncbi:MAG: EAL domain-containing protein, partial [Candidatus Limnocylindrales bacterium]
VAEGIEEPGQLERLRSLGCEFGQGFLFSRPVSAEHLARLLGVPAGVVLVGADSTAGDRAPVGAITFPVGG